MKGFYVRFANYRGVNRKLNTTSDLSFITHVINTEEWSLDSDYKKINTRSKYPSLSLDDCLRFYHSDLNKR